MKALFQRNVQTAAYSGFLLLSALGAAGQVAFQNLGFEDTTITPILVNPLSGFYRSIATLPGWTWSPFSNYVNQDPTAVSFNDRPIDAPGVTLQGTGPNAVYPALSGNYSVLLLGGSMFVGPTNGGASVFQTGLIPDTAKSLIYLGGASLEVSFAGQSLSPIALESTPNYTEWGVDISPYAGQSGELRFAVPWESGSMLDGIQFSPNPIPEPSVLSLSLIGFGFVVAFTQRARRLR